MADDDRPPHLGWSLFRHFVLGGLVIAVLTGAVAATAALEKVSTIAHEVFPTANEIHAPRNVIVPIYSGQPETFLLIGSDKRAESKDVYDRADPPHSDTMLLVRLDPAQGQTSVLSVPRDLLVSITLPGGQVDYPEKMNAAYTLGFQYVKGTRDGGAVLAAETIEHLLHIKINALIDTTFGGFVNAVDSLGCVYIDVDHYYYNPPNDGYAQIDLQPGYQRLCYDNALSYVRYRHDDSDFVRVARQQNFLRSAREQIPVSRIISHPDRIAKEIGAGMITSFTPSTSEFITLLKLIAFSQQKPLRQVPFQYASDNTLVGPPGQQAEYVTTTSQLIQATVHDFLYGDQHLKIPHQTAVVLHHGHSHKVPFATIAAESGLVPESSADRQQAGIAGANVPFTLMFPNYE
ncbi:MAG TPA: LCP family protein, partial [Solirubrobacteraceae bacterium]|nr:LCP family protein [Solirubrobacteraceae bacterium]